MAKLSKEREDDKYRKPKSNRSLDIGRFRLPLLGVALILSVLVLYLVTHPLQK
eukprot:CAMPEP_0118949354 /NCGR_PEP_ID=MMETSP1169-20130426/49472_1 /TAXON_ID=36882 /ORGANISM="Pyramimonas obovata, Strain CCMP722" /LENGTH=52 /DNA_ID=CAMNT_0006895969 /DNA_START=195 /DNA_END=350 /DNA_ORIENTATION=+